MRRNRSLVRQSTPGGRSPASGSVVVSGDHSHRPTRVVSGLVKTLAAPIPHQRRAKLTGARVATTPLAPPPSQPRRAVRRVGADGTFAVARPRGLQVDNSPPARRPGGPQQTGHEQLRDHAAGTGLQHGVRTGDPGGGGVPDFRPRAVGCASSGWIRRSVLTLTFRDF